MNIFKKMLKVTEAVQNVEKKGHNAFANYDYVRAVDVIGSVQKELVANKISLVITETAFVPSTETTAAGKANHYTDLKCQASFVNAEKPDEKITVDYFARASDTGDKDIYKAKTNGLKYLLTQQFMIITDVLVDAEQDNKFDTHNATDASKVATKTEAKKKDISVKEATNIITGEKATLIQCDKIEKLVQKRKNPDASMDRVMTKYNVMSYRELTKAQADEIIAILEKPEGK